MLTMILGEIANFAAYAFAPAILVTPLGALSIIVSAVLAHYLLAEKLHPFDGSGALCIVGSVSIVLNAPEERQVSGVKELAALAAQPASSRTPPSSSARRVPGALRAHARQHADSRAHRHLFADGFAVRHVVLRRERAKLTFEGNNQLYDLETYACAATVACCVVTQMNYSPWRSTSSTPRW